MVASNALLYGSGEHPDHCVVIKYVPAVGDSKRALDEYTSDIFMGGTSTIVSARLCLSPSLRLPCMFAVQCYLRCGAQCSVCCEAWVRRLVVVSRSPDPPG